MGPDREQSMLIVPKSKLAAKEVVILIKATLESLKITKLAKMVATTTITVNEGIISVAAAETAVDRAVIVAEGTMESAQGAWATTIFGQSTLRIKLI